MINPFIVSDKNSRSFKIKKAVLKKIKTNSLAKSNLIIVIESIAKDNVTILLFLTIILCLLLGMGLPTTANYVVVASLMATVLVDVGNASGFIFPLIAVHLFCLLYTSPSPRD